MVLFARTPDGLVPEAAADEIVARDRGRKQAAARGRPRPRERPAWRASDAVRIAAPPGLRQGRAHADLAAPGCGGRAGRRRSSWSRASSSATCRGARPTSASAPRGPSTATSSCSRDYATSSSRCSPRSATSRPNAGAIALGGVVAAGTPRSGCRTSPTRAWCSAATIRRPRGWRSCTACVGVLPLRSLASRRRGAGDRPGLPALPGRALWLVGHRAVLDRRRFVVCGSSCSTCCATAPGATRRALARASATNTGGDESIAGGGARRRIRQHEASGRPIAGARGSPPCMRLRPHSPARPLRRPVVHPRSGRIPPGTGEQTDRGGPPSAAASARSSRAVKRRATVAPDMRRAAPLLTTLAVRPRDARTRYAREGSGHAWLDVDKNGCDTRDDILRRDLKDVRLEPGKRPCVVRPACSPIRTPTRTSRSSAAAGPRSTSIAWSRLADAWATGAAAWRPGRRIALAGDPLNLGRSRPRPIARRAAATRRCGCRTTRLPLCLRGPPDRRRGQVRPVGHQGGARRDDPGAARLPGPARARGRRADRRADRRAAREAASRGAGQTKPAPAKPAPAAEKPRGVDPDYGTCKEAKAHGAGPYRRGRRSRVRVLPGRRRATGSSASRVSLRHVLHARHVRIKKCWINTSRGGGPRRRCRPGAASSSSRFESRW